MNALERELLVSALEAVECGDMWLAVEILLELRDGPEPERRYACEACGHLFAWPGLVDAHRERCVQVLWSAA